MMVQNGKQIHQILHDALLYVWILGIVGSIGYTDEFRWFQPGHGVFMTGWTGGRCGNTGNTPKYLE